MLKQIPLWENNEEITREFLTIVEDSVYADFGNLLLRLSGPTVPDRKSIERIWQVLQGLPRDQEPYYCKISFVDSSPVVYTRRFEIEQNGNKKGKGIDTSRPDEEVIVVEYGTDKPIDIKFYQYPSDNVEDPNADEFGSYQPDLSFEGRWAILKILFTYNNRVPDNEGFIRLPFKDKIKKEEKEQIVDKDLRLKLAFYRDKECQDPIDGFVQALLSKE